MKKSFKNFLKIIVFVAIVFIADKLIGFVLYKYYFLQTSGPNYEMTYLFNECKSDVIIFGNSRAMHHYDTRIISDSLKMSCYNAGKDGLNNMAMIYAELKVVAGRFLPKIVILESDLDFELAPYLYDRLSVLLPYYRDYPEMQQIVLLRGPYEKFKLLSEIYPFNSSLLNIIRYNGESLALQKQNLNYSGYIPLKNKLNNKFFVNENVLEKEKSCRTEIDSNSLKAFKELVLLCQQKNIKLYIVNSPIFYPSGVKKIPPPKVTEYPLNFLNQQKVNFLDFSYDTNFVDKKDWFNDSNHLNEDGAKAFTNILVKILQN